jgi:hypothetical protein
MKAELFRNRTRRAKLAAFALLWFITGCGDPATGTFDFAASKKIADEKGIGPGGPRAKLGGRSPDSAAARSKTVGASIPKR